MTAHQMLARARNLPPVSTAALELAGLLAETEINNEEIVRVLKHDSVLTAKLLRACNSPALGLAQPVASVDQAVLLLGHRRVYQTVIAISVGGPMAVPLPGYGLDANGLWQHSLLAATSAETAILDGVNLEVDASVAFTVGLLHDIGKLVTNQFITAQSLLAMRRLVAEGRTGLEAERVVLGTDHAEVGAGLIYLWRLPDQIVEAVALHHQPRLTPQPRLSALASFADQVAHLATLPQSDRAHKHTESAAEVFKVLGFDEERLESLICSVCESSEDSHKALMAA
jgi:putative nucleotidyltransferase with HDIG domain